MKTIILIAMIAAVAYAEEAASAPLEAKKQDKRGVLGLGYGGYYPGVAAHGYPGYGGYGHYGAGPYYSVNHGVVPAYSHAAAPAVSYSHGYHAPAVYNPYRVGYGYNGYNGYNHAALGYNGLGLGLGYNYLNGGHYW